ncbi:MAG: hypothetical protein OXU77_20405 [Gammaproteobacteria bacterium]|nr:hypothetical protein [Gammaproteobacteria bacterium]
MANVNTRRPRKADLCRAVSSSYYALFHCLAKNCADLLARTGTHTSRPAWRQAYRALQHGTAKSRCEQRDVMRRFPNPIQDFGNLFVEMQRKRHTADYDPDAQFRKSDVVTDIDRVEDVVARFSRVAATERRALAIHVLLAQRKS